MMKKVVKSSILVLVIAILGHSNVLGQVGMGYQFKKEKMKAKKIAFITQRLNLTSQEAEKFWPIYNEETAKIEKIFSEIRESFTPMNELTDEEAIQKANAIMDMESEVIAHKKAMIQNLKGVIPGKKILQLMRTEKTFRKQMLKEMRGNRMKRKRVQ